MKLTKLTKKCSLSTKTLYVLPYSENLKLPDKMEAHREILQKRLSEKNLKAGETFCVSLPLDGEFYSITIYKPGEKLDAYSVTEMGTSIANAILSNELSKVHLHIDENLSEDLAVRFVASILLGSDTFDTYKTKKAFHPDELAICEANKFSNSLIEKTMALVKAVSLSRMLGNEPANVMTPSTLAKNAVDALTPLGVKVSVKGLAEIKKIGMEAFLSVAKGSSEEPKFIIMEFLNNKKSDKRLALVGKGLTYDSGGYSIKPTSGMLTMKCDMCGAGAVIGAMHYLAETKANVNVVALVAACENMISGTAYKPGDIISSLAGKTIEIDNTDAEGRLTLADAVCYAHTKVKATHIVDICTLTGACVVALGENITGVLTNDDDLRASLKAATSISGDKTWEMPLDKDLMKGLKSDVADMKNTGSRWGGMMTAGMFVQEFVGDTPWMHLDIAGPAFHEKGGSFYPNGASGVGAEYLAEMAKNLFK